MIQEMSLNNNSVNLLLLILRVTWEFVVVNKIVFDKANLENE